MKIVDIALDFQHRGTAYRKGQRVEVTWDEALYFCRSSFATDPSGVISSHYPVNADTALTVQDIIIDTQGVTR